MKIPITLFTLTEMDNMKIPGQKYKPTDLDHDSSKESYIGLKPPVDLSPEFDVCNYTNPNTK